MDEIDFGGGVPPWRQLLAILRARVESGEINGRFPSDKTISQEYGVSINTVRKATAVLKAEGLIEASQGWGSRVVPPEERQPKTAPSA